MTFGHIYNVQTGYQAKCGPFNVLAELYFIVALIRGPLGVNCHTGTICSSGSGFHNYSITIDMLLHRDKISPQSWPKSIEIMSVLGLVYNRSILSWNDTVNIVIANGLQGGCFVWVEMSRGRFVVERITNAIYLLTFSK